MQLNKSDSLLSLHCQGLESVIQVMNLYRSIVELTEVNYTVYYWQRIARICWIIAKRASYLSDMILGQLQGGTSIYGSALQAKAFLGSPRGNMFLGCLNCLKESISEVLEDVTQQISLIRLQAEEIGNDPILSYDPSKDISGGIFRKEVEAQLESAKHWVGTAVKNLTFDKANLVQSQVESIKKLFVQMEAISQGKTITK